MVHNNRVGAIAIGTGRSDHQTAPKQPAPMRITAIINNHQIDTEGSGGPKH